MMLMEYNPELLNWMWVILYKLSMLYNPDAAQCPKNILKWTVQELLTQPSIHPSIILLALYLNG